MIQFTFGTIFRGSPRFGTQVSRNYLQEKLSTQLQWNATQYRVSIQHPSQPQRPARPRNDDRIQAGGTILNSRNTQMQPRRNVSNYNQGNTGGQRNSSGQRGSGSSESQGNSGSQGKQGNFKFSAAAAAAGFMAGFKMTGSSSNKSGSRSGGGFDSGSGGDGGDSSDDNDDDQTRIPWKTGTWSSGKGGSFMPTQGTDHFQYKGKDFVEITVDGKRSWISPHKNGYKYEVWKVVKQGNDLVLELDYQFDSKGKRPVLSHQKSK